MRTFLLLLSGAGLLGAQPFTLGIKAGVPLTDFFSTVQSPRFGFNSNTKRYIVGGTAELRLPAGFALELDALYRRLNYSSGGTLIDVFTNSATSGNAWEFPLLVKYRAGHGAARPFVDVGVAFDTVSGLKQTVTNTLFATNRTTTTTTNDAAELRKRVNKGFVIGAGIDLHAVLIHLSPEIRYTRWGSETFRDPASMLLNTRNQAEFLLGITF